MSTTRRGLLAVLLLTTVLGATPALAQNPQPQGPGITVPITGTVGSAVLAGNFTIQRFVRNGSNILAVGRLVGTFTDPATGIVRNFATQLSLPVLPTAATASCDILNLVLGPLDLNLLGLEVHLNQVVLDIVATPGAGNLLGNLLCSVANLLNGGLGGGLGQLTALLNQLLNILG